MPSWIRFPLTSDATLKQVKWCVVVNVDLMRMILRNASEYGLGFLKCNVNIYFSMKRKSENKYYVQY